MPFFFHFFIHFPFFFFQCIWIIKTLIIIFNDYTVLTTHGCTTTDRVNTLFFIWITIEWDFQKIITSRHIKWLIFIFRDGIFGWRFFTVQFVVNCVWVCSSNPGLLRGIIINSLGNPNTWLLRGILIFLGLIPTFIYAHTLISTFFNAHIESFSERILLFWRVFFFSHKSRRVFFYRYQSLLYFEVKWVEFKHTFLYFFILNLVKFVLFFWRFLYK